MTPRCSEQLKLLTMTNVSYRTISKDELRPTAWSTKWLLTFHPDKCKIMHLGKPLEEQFKYTLLDGTNGLFGVVRDMIL